MMMATYVSWLQQHYPEVCHDLHSCMHNYSTEDLNPYHIESDCWSHTMMVCKVAEMGKFNKRVQVAALLHDIGKPACREINPHNNHVRFFGHEGLSAYMSLEILYTMQRDGLIECEDIPAIFVLISLHALLHKKHSDTDIVRKFRYDIGLYEDLHALNYCDNMGRFSSSLQEVQKEIPKELIEQMSNSESDSHLYEGPKLELLVGMSNCGKSTYRQKRIDDGFEGVIISRDALVMKHGRGESYTECWNSLSEKEQSDINRELEVLFDSAVVQKKEIMVDMMNLSRNARAQWIERAEEVYVPTATVFLTPYNEICSRNEAQRSYKYLDEKILQDMAKRFVFPLYDEVESITHIFADNG